MTGQKASLLCSPMSFGLGTIVFPFPQDRQIVDPNWKERKSLYEQTMARQD
jgi:hypothetical protein